MSDITPLLREVQLRNVWIRNRVWVSPMCQYSAPDGHPTEWHFAHYSSLATSTGAVIVEATAISQLGRVTPQDLVLSSSSSLENYTRLAACIASRGALPAIQLSHSGRKGSRTRPWEGDVALAPDNGGWQIISSSPIPFGAGYQTPVEMSRQQIREVVEEFAQAAALAKRAEFRLIEVHGGHGRLVHSFLSGVANKRTDEFGGSLENRSRFARDVARRIRAEIGEDCALSFRLSCVDWCDGGLSLDDSVQIAKWLKEDGVDLIDCSSGGIVRPLDKKARPGYQVPFAEAIRRDARMATAAVGLIESLEQGAQIIDRRQADVVLLGRRLMTDPFALMRKAAEARATELVPPQYLRASLAQATPAEEHIPEL